MNEKDTAYKKIICPQCGRVMPIRILSFSGELKYSVKCKDCKQTSIVELSTRESQ